LPVHFRSLFAKAAQHRKDGVASQFVEAAAVAERLFADPPDHRPLHGDIHHENIIEGPRGWLAIDPKGLIGDRAFDAANLFYNPIESPLRHSETRVASVSAILSARTGIAPAHLLDHAFAFSALSASWHVEDGNLDEAQASLAVGKAVRAVRDAISS
jgi:streptomycin 6-kinase